MVNDEEASFEATSKEMTLLKMIRDLGFGEIIIHVVDGQPIRVEEIKKSIKL